MALRFRSSKPSHVHPPKAKSDYERAHQQLQAGWILETRKVQVTLESYCKLNRDLKIKHLERFVSHWKRGNLSNKSMVQEGNPSVWGCRWFDFEISVFTFDNVFWGFDVWFETWMPQPVLWVFRCRGTGRCVVRESLISPGGWRSWAWALAAWWEHSCDSSWLNLWQTIGNLVVFWYFLLWLPFMLVNNHRADANLSTLTPQHRIALHSSGPGKSHSRRTSWGKWSICKTVATWAAFGRPQSTSPKIFPSYFLSPSNLQKECKTNIFLVGLGEKAD